MAQLNFDLTQHSPIQVDSNYATVPLPSAHLVVIEKSEMRESSKDGFVKGVNLVLEMTILNSSCGNEYVGQIIPCYIPFANYDEKALQVGAKRLSTIAHILGLSGHLQSSEELHGQAFIVVLEKQKDVSFANFKRILTSQGLEIADASGNMKPCSLSDNALQVELDKLIDIIEDGGARQQPQQVQQPQQSFVPNNFGFGGQQPQQVQQPQQSFVPAQPNFSGQFGGQPPQGQWTQTINTNNGQTA